jgi:hypothetical protein
VFCPFHSDAEWLRLKNEEPESFQEAVKFEVEYQSSLSQVSGFRGKPYLHNSLVPLSEIDFRPNAERNGQMNLFENECEGMCGV